VDWSDDVLDAVPEAIVVTGPDGHVELANAAAERLFGGQRRELTGRPVEALIPGGLPAGSGRLDVLARRADGREFPADLSLSRTDTRTVVLVRDVTERRGEARAQDLLAAIVLSSHDAIVSMTLDRRILSWNHGAEILYGYSAAEMVGRPADVVIPEDRRSDEREIISLVSLGARLERFRTGRVRRDGTLISVSLAVSPLTDRAGTIIGVAWTARDFSERERAEVRFQAVLEAAPDAIVGVDRAGDIVLVNTQTQRMFGYARHELVGRPVRELLPEGLPADFWQTHSGAVAVRAAEAEPVVARRHEGDTFPAEMTISGLETEDGPVACLAIRDVTERVHAQAEQARLRAEAESERVEARMHRTQRLESLGQLAGGVAHDFNNLLAVILNYGTFVIEEAAEPDPDLAAIARDGEQIVRASKRGTELTHQLLAFARREVVRPQVLDLNQVILDVEQMLRRSIGEHIALATRLGAGVPPITADPGQMEQVLVNLAVNARDAMPAGGRLTIETGAVDIDDDQAANRPGLDPGRYARVRVSDTGSGMAKEVVDRAFEPFYTTKRSGEGTGLGLATVYGIVTQARGSVQIYSEPGLGTTVTIMLPVTDDPDAVVAAGPEPARDGGRGNGETILVVEDEPALRDLACRILDNAGYRVLSAEGGAAALDLAGRHSGEIDLLLTDVIMPGILGKELAERLLARDPRVRVLFMSGYAQPILASRGTLDPGVTLIEKPFGKSELLAAVHRQLTAARAGAGRED
jgi:two-component system, cell cycle sensor histidine kinase and response regulator CckA